MVCTAKIRTVNLDHLVDRLKVEQLDALLHELHAPPTQDNNPGQYFPFQPSPPPTDSAPIENPHAPDELLHVPKHRLHILDRAIKVVRHRAALPVLPVHPAQLAEHLGVELLLEHLVDLELVAPLERVDEHVRRVLDDEVARAHELGEDDGRLRGGRRRRELDAPERDRAGGGLGVRVGLLEDARELGLQSRQKVSTRTRT